MPYAPPYKALLIPLRFYETKTYVTKLLDVNKKHDISVKTQKMHDQNTVCSAGDRIPMEFSHPQEARNVYASLQLRPAHPQENVPVEERKLLHIEHLALFRARCLSSSPEAGSVVLANARFSDSHIH